MDIRRALPVEAEQIVDLINRVAASDASLGIDAFPFGADTEAAFLASHDPRVHLALVAVEGGHVAGHLYASRGTTPYLLHVGSLALVVAPEYRRHHIGSGLLAAARDWGVEVGVAKMTLSVLASNAPARGLFESAGYRDEGARQGQFRIGGAEVDEVLMALWLDRN